MLPPSRNIGVLLNPKSRVVGNVHKYQLWLYFASLLERELSNNGKLILLFCGFYGEKNMLVPLNCNPAEHDCFHLAPRQRKHGGSVFCFCFLASEKDMKNIV